MQQQQPGIVAHSCISSLLISRQLTRSRVASRYSVRTSSVTESGRGKPKICERTLLTSGWTPLSKFLNPPLLSLHLFISPFIRSFKLVPENLLFPFMQESTEKTLNWLPLVLARVHHSKRVQLPYAPVMGQSAVSMLSCETTAQIVFAADEWTNLMHGHS